MVVPPTRIARRMAQLLMEMESVMRLVMSWVDLDCSATARVRIRRPYYRTSEVRFVQLAGL